MDDNKLWRRTSSVRISIGSFHRLFDEIGKEYTVYQVKIAKPGGSKVIQKRYSEFYKLNKILKVKHKLPPGIEFPPKKLNPRRTSTKEERCRKLEKYMQIICDHDPIPTEVLSFLDISLRLPQPSFTNESPNDVNSSCEDLVEFKSTHQPILGFLTDPFIAEQPGNLLNGILLDGVLNALYEDATENG